MFLRIFWVSVRFIAPFGNDYILDLEIVIDLSLVCNFKKMKSHLDVKESEVPAEKLAAVAEVLRNKSTFLRLSEDGAFWPHFAMILEWLLFLFYNGEK